MIIKIAQRAKELGWEVIKMEKTGNDEAIVMIYRKNAPIQGKHYSVHSFYNNSFYSGSYDLSKEQANKVFDSRLN